MMMGRYRLHRSLWGLSPDQINAIDLIVSGGRTDTPELVNAKRVLVRRGLIRNIGYRAYPNWVRVDPLVDSQTVATVLDCVEGGDDTGGKYADIDESERLDALYVLRNRGLIYQKTDSWDRGWAAR